MAEEEKKVTAKKTATKTTAAKKTTATKATKTTKTTTAKKATTTKTVKAAAAKTTEKPAVKAEKKVEVKANEELVAKATVKYERMSSRKVAIVANLIRGKNADEAMAILRFTPKAGAEVLTKLLKSAIANAENTKNMTHSKLYVAEIYSNQGPTLKRIRPAAKGSAVRIRKRTSHTTIVLKERV
ncbi:MAG: 50S ribosomal protein L22 [Clostridiales bacterium]|nr:50S ribosomal protein L22 [Clostridiales bacterium]